MITLGEYADTQCPLTIIHASNEAQWQQAAAAVKAALVLAGLLCLVFYPGIKPVLSTLLLGTGIGALFPLSLIVTLDHARSDREAGILLSRV